MGQYEDDELRRLRDMGVIGDDGEVEVGNKYDGARLAHPSSLGALGGETATDMNKQDGGVGDRGVGDEAPTLDTATAEQLIQAVTEQQQLIGARVQRLAQMGVTVGGVTEMFLDAIINYLFPGERERLVFMLQANNRILAAFDAAEAQVNRAVLLQPLPGGAGGAMPGMPGANGVPGPAGNGMPPVPPKLRRV